MNNKKITIVTGASKGIGKAISFRLIEDGCFIIAVDVDKKNGLLLQNEMGVDKMKFMYCDVQQQKDVITLYENIIKEYNRVDILVNNAGIIKDNMIHNMSLDDFESVINVNLKGTWLMCKEASTVMRKQRSGRIVNISSRAWLGNRGQSNYSASKAGIIGLTRVLALELGKYNVLVNAIAPGLIDTPLTQALSKELLNQLIESQPTRTIGKPEDVANTVAFLANDRTQFITGQTIYVDGGKSIGANY